MTHYDLIVIGAGPAGHAAAEHAAKLGKKVAIVEKGQWGGTCTNVGCIPTKALLACSKALADTKKLRRLGVKISEVSFDFSAMKRHQNQMVKTSFLGVRSSLEQVGVTLIEAEAHLLEDGTVSIEKDSGPEIISADHTVIAWGSETTLFPSITLSERILTSKGLLALPSLPEDIIIIGGGIIGVEFATFLSELGVKVTIIELGDQILPGEDVEVAEVVAKELKAHKVDILTQTKMEEIKDLGDKVELNMTDTLGEHHSLEAAYALIAVGRRPRLYPEELDGLKIEYDRRGIKIDENMQTSVNGIYAIGDVVGGALLAHRASQQGKTLADRLFGKAQFSYQPDAIPFVTYCHPSISRVGITETQAIAQGLKNIEVLRFEYSANMIARANLMNQGFVKVIYQEDKLLGITIVGDESYELIASMSLAFANQLTRQDFKKWMIAHPTLSEVLNVLQ